MGMARKSRFQWPESYSFLVLSARKPGRKRTRKRNENDLDDPPGNVELRLGRTENGRTAVANRAGKVSAAWRRMRHLASLRRRSSMARAQTRSRLVSTAL